MSKKTLLEKSVAEAVNLIKVSLTNAEEEAYETYCLGLLKTYEEQAKHLLAEGVEASALVEEQLEYIRQYRTQTRPEDLALQTLLRDAEVNAPGWSERVRAYFGPAGTCNKSLRDIATKVLNQPVAIHHPEWSTLVKEFIECSQEYAAITADVYGVALTYGRDEDEGGVRDAFDSGKYSTLKLLFEKILPSEAALKHPDWEHLVIYALDALERYIYTPDEEIQRMFATLQIREHAAWADLFTHYIQKNTAFQYKQAVTEALAQPWLREHKDFGKIREVFRSVSPFA